MAINKNDLIDRTTDLFQVLNTIKWEASQLDKTKQKLESVHFFLVTKVQSNDKPTTAANVRDSIKDAHKVLDDAIKRANFAKQYLESLSELF